MNCNFETEFVVARLAKRLNVSVLIWGARNECPDENGLRLRASQCARATEIYERPGIREMFNRIKQKTGLMLSPFFPASKIAWFLENVRGAKGKSVLNSMIVKGFLKVQSPFMRL